MFPFTALLLGCFASRPIQPIRDPSTSLWALMNFVDRTTSNVEGHYDANVDYGDNTGSIFMNAVGYRGGNEGWDIFDNVVYANNSTAAPDLRNLPNQNYLSPGLQAFGLTLMSFITLLGLVTITWVFVHRKHNVLLAAQPMFLYLIAFGSILFSFGILSVSFDESYGWSEVQLNRACVSQSWFVSVGYNMIIYGALYSNLWRVEPCPAIFSKTCWLLPCRPALCDLAGTDCDYPCSCNSFGAGAMGT